MVSPAGPAETLMLAVKPYRSSQDAGDATDILAFSQTSYHTLCFCCLCCAAPMRAYTPGLAHVTTLNVMPAASWWRWQTWHNCYQGEAKGVSSLAGHVPFAITFANLAATVISNGSVIVTLTCLLKPQKDNLWSSCTNCLHMQGWPKKLGSDR